MKITIVAKTELKTEYACDDDDDIIACIKSSLEDTKEKAAAMNIRIENWDVKVKPD